MSATRTTTRALFGGGAPKLSVPALKDIKLKDIDNRSIGEFLLAFPSPFSLLSADAKASLSFASSRPVAVRRKGPSRDERREQLRIHGEVSPLLSLIVLYESRRLASLSFVGSDETLAVSPPARLHGTKQLQGSRRTLRQVPRR